MPAWRRQFPLSTGFVTPLICLDDNRPSVPPALSQTVKSQFVRPATTDPTMLPEQLKAESVYHSCNLWDLFRRIYSLRTGLLKRVRMLGYPSRGAVLFCTVWQKPSC